MVSQSNSVDKIFRNWHRSYAGHDVVYMPPGWKDLFPVPFTFVYTTAELTADDYVSFFRYCIRYQISNPRLLTPRTLQYASCFHPSLYRAVQKNKSANSTDAKNSTIIQWGLLKMNEHVSPELDFPSVKYWLQSVLFLAGITLSTAIIQNRWSACTLESKLNRLWQVAQCKNIPGLESLRELNIESFVLNCRDQLLSKPKHVLRDLKLFYSQVLKSLTRDIPCVRKELKKAELTASQNERFGFIKDLQSMLGKNMKCVITYGSAVSTAHFAAYDLIVIVKNIALALDSLAETAPQYKGLELNIALFDQADFDHYQLASGDNLVNNALCLYGSAMVPHKPSNDLIARNYSFGFIRYKQLMGMASRIGNITGYNEDKLNLLNYFIKTPLNVFNGIQRCYTTIGTNEDIKEWMKTTIDFDADLLQLKATKGYSMDSIAHAAWATQEVMHWFDKKYTIFYRQYQSETTAINHPKQIYL
jgi:hypothetical protein